MASDTLMHGKKRLERSWLWMSAINPDQHSSVDESQLLRGAMNSYQRHCEALKVYYRSKAKKISLPFPLHTISFHWQVFSVHCLI